MHRLIAQCSFAERDALLESVDLHPILKKLGLQQHNVLEINQQNPIIAHQAVQIATDSREVHHRNQTRRITISPQVIHNHLCEFASLSKVAEKVNYYRLFWEGRVRLSMKSWEMLQKLLPQRSMKIKACGELRTEKTLFT